MLITTKQNNFKKKKNKPVFATVLSHSTALRVSLLLYSLRTAKVSYAMSSPEGPTSRKVCVLGLA